MRSAEQAARGRRAGRAKMASIPLLALALLALLLLAACGGASAQPVLLGRRGLDRFDLLRGPFFGTGFDGLGFEGFRRFPVATATATASATAIAVAG
jgi:hypothetical protein